MTKEVNPEVFCTKLNKVINEYCREKTQRIGGFPFHDRNWFNPEIFANDEFTTVMEEFFRSVFPKDESLSFGERMKIAKQKKSEEE